MLLAGKEDRREGRDSSWLVTYFKHMLMTNNNNNEDITHKLLSTICPSGLVSRGHLYIWGPGFCENRIETTES